jgi:hypothetical protein
MTSTEPDLDRSALIDALGAGAPIVHGFDHQAGAVQSR